MGITGYIVVTAEFRREGGKITAFCPELGTATFGRSLPEAERKLREAIELHLYTLEELEQREAFFKEHDIPFYTDRLERASLLVQATTESWHKAIVQSFPLSTAVV